MDSGSLMSFGPNQTVITKLNNESKVNIDSKAANDNNDFTPKMQSFGAASFMAGSIKSKGGSINSTNSMTEMTRLGDDVEIIR